MSRARILALVPSLWLVVSDLLGLRSQSQRQPELTVSITRVSRVVNRHYNTYQVVLAVDGDNDNLMLPIVSTCIISQILSRTNISDD